MSTHAPALGRRPGTATGSSAAAANKPQWRAGQVMRGTAWRLDDNPKGTKLRATRNSGLTSRVTGRDGSLAVARTVEDHLERARPRGVPSRSRCIYVMPPGDTSSLSGWRQHGGMGDRPLVEVSFPGQATVLDAGIVNDMIAEVQKGRRGEADYGQRERLDRLAEAYWAGQSADEAGCRTHRRSYLEGLVPEATIESAVGSDPRAGSATRGLRKTPARRGPEKAADTRDAGAHRRPTVRARPKAAVTKSSGSNADIFIRTTKPGQSFARKAPDGTLYRFQHGQGTKVPKEFGQALLMKDSSLERVR